jgi:hypothetical protein
MAGETRDEFAHGRRAYEGYRAYSDGKSLVSGQPIPEFDQLPEQIKRAWQASADYLLAGYMSGLAAAGLKELERV